MSRGVGLLGGTRRGYRLEIRTIAKMSEPGVSFQYMPLIDLSRRRLNSTFILSQLNGTGPFELILDETYIDGDLNIAGKTFSQISLNACRCNGTITFQDCNLPSVAQNEAELLTAKFTMRRARIGGGFRLRRTNDATHGPLSTWGQLDLTDSTIGASIEVDGITVERLSLVQARIGGSLKVRRKTPMDPTTTALHTTIRNDLDAHGVVVGGDVLLRGVTIQGRAVFSNSRIGGVFSAQVWKPQTRDADPMPINSTDAANATLMTVDPATLFPTKILCGLWLTRANVTGGVLLQGTQIHGQLDARFASIGGLDLSSEPVEGCDGEFTLEISQILRVRMATYRGAFRSDFGISARKAEWIERSEAALRQSHSLMRESDQKTYNAALRLAHQNTLTRSWNYNRDPNRHIQLEILGNGYRLDWKNQDDFGYGLIPKFTIGPIRDFTHESNGVTLRAELRFPDEPDAYSDLFDFSVLVKPSHFRMSWPENSDPCGLSSYVGWQAKKLWDEIPPNVGITHISGEVQLDSISIAGDLVLSGARLLSGLRLPGATIAGRFDATSKPSPLNANTEELTAESKFYPTRIGVMKLHSPKFAVSIHAENLKLGKSFQIAGAHLQSGVNLMGSSIGGNVFLSGDESNRTVIGAATGPNRRIYSLRLSASEIGGNVLFHGAFLSNGITAKNAKIEGDISGISSWVDALKGTAERRTYVGQGYWDKHERASLHLNGVRLKGDADFRGAFLEGGVLCESAEIDGFLGLGSIDRSGSRLQEASDDFYPMPGTEDERYVSCFIGPAQDSLLGAFSVILSNSKIAGSIDFRGAIIRTGIYAGHAIIDGDVLLQRFLPRTAHQASTFTCVGPGLGAGWQLSLRNSNTSEAALFTPNAKIGGHIYLHGAVLASGWSGSGTSVRGSILASPFDSKFQMETQTIVGPGRRHNRECCIRLPHSRVGGDVELVDVSFREHGIRMYPVGSEGSRVLDDHEVTANLADSRKSKRPLINFEDASVGGRFRVSLSDQDRRVARYRVRNVVFELASGVEAVGNGSSWRVRGINGLGLEYAKAVLALMASWWAWFVVAFLVIYGVVDGQDMLKLSTVAEPLAVPVAVGVACISVVLLACYRVEHTVNSHLFEVEGLKASQFDVQFCGNQVADVLRRYQLVINARRPAGHGSMFGTDFFASTCVGTLFWFSVWACCSGLILFRSSGVFVRSEAPGVVFVGLLFAFSAAVTYLARNKNLFERETPVRRGASAYRRRQEVVGKLMFLAGCPRNESIYNQLEQQSRESGDHYLADRIALHWQGRDLLSTLRSWSSLGRVFSFLLMGQGVRGGRVVTVVCSLFFLNIAFLVGVSSSNDRFLAEPLVQVQSGSFPGDEASAVSDGAKVQANVGQIVGLAASPFVQARPERPKAEGGAFIVDRVAQVRLLLPDRSVLYLESRMGMDSTQGVFRSVGVFLLVIVTYAFFRHSPRLQKLRGYND